MIDCENLTVIHLIWTQNPSWGFMKSSWVNESYLGAFWSSFGVVTQSLVLEKVWKIVGDWRKERDTLFSNFHYHNSLVNVGVLALVIYFFMLIHAWILRIVLSCCLFSFLCVGFDLERFCFVLDAFFCLSWWNIFEGI